MEHLQSFIGDCDRRTEQAKQRLAETQEELSAEVAQKANKVHELAEQIGEKLARAEQLGAEGLVEESMKLMGELEDLRKKKALAEQEYRNSMPASSYQQQKLRVCEVCSAYLGIHDNDKRLADHFGGKLHLGFIKIREKLAELEKAVEARRNQRSDKSRERDRERDERQRDRDRYWDMCCFSSLTFPQLIPNNDLVFAEIAVIGRTNAIAVGTDQVEIEIVIGIVADTNDQVRDLIDVQGVEAGTEAVDHPDLTDQDPGRDVGTENRIGSADSRGRLTKMYREGGKESMIECE